MLVTPSDWVETPKDYVQVEAPERLRKAIVAANKRYDVLIVDEAQDIQPYWWVALEALLQDPETSKLYAFFDRAQGVFGGGEVNGASYTPEETLPVPANYMQLGRNYRNTRQISEFSRGFRRSSMAQMPAASDRDGYMPIVIRYSDAEDAKKKIADLVRELTDERGVNEDEIMLLSGRAPENKDSVLSGVDVISGLKITKLSSERLREPNPIKHGEIGIATIAAFKGLESKIVIAFNLSEYNLAPDHPIMSSLIYVALTRAKHMLYVLVKDGDVKADTFERLLKSVRRGASLVLNGEERVGERTGTVIHYNPERAGVISIDVGAEDQPQTVLMFGPDLKRAGLASIKREDRLVFRVRTEGGVSFAVDLRRDEQPD